LAIDAARSLKSEDALERLSDLFVRRGAPTYVRSDNGSEFTATKVRDWLARVGVKTLFVEPGKQSPRMKSCIVIESRTSLRPTPSSSAG
jgi:transposase InsO family protein